MHCTAAEINLVISVEIAYHTEQNSCNHPEYQEKIFTPFFRVDKSRSRAMGGAGLGLALVSEIVRQHNGQVKVLESSKKGSIITIMLPV